MEQTKLVIQLPNTCIYPASIGANLYGQHIHGCIYRAMMKCTCLAHPFQGMQTLPAVPSALHPLPESPAWAEGSYPSSMPYASPLYSLIMIIELLLLVIIIPIMYIVWIFFLKSEVPWATSILDRVSMVTGIATQVELQPVGALWDGDGFV